MSVVDEASGDTASRSATNADTWQATALDASDNIVFDDSGRNVALLGVNNLIVVRTRDAVLVCHRHHAERIKNLVAKLPEGLQ